MKYRFLTVWVVLLSLLLSGCTMITIDQMYSLPKRSDSYNNLQVAMDEAMQDLEYCAPVSGENQQTVQIADLDGDGALEYLLFARSTEAQPLRILIFRNVDGDYIHMDTIKSNGTEFDRVEYVKMDSSRATMLVVGRKISDELMRTLSVYTYSTQGVEQLSSINYREFLPTDLDNDGIGELFVLRSGIAEEDNGVAGIYNLNGKMLECANEVDISQPADNLQRVLVGNLQDGAPGVFVTYTSATKTTITDAFAVRNGMLTNITLSDDLIDGVQSMGDYYMLADDIDGDGVIELPNLLTTADFGDDAHKHSLILWYALNISGERIDKTYTYHNFTGGWYLRLNNEWADAVAVHNFGNRYEFVINNKDAQLSRHVMTIFVNGNQIWEDKDQKGDINLQTTQSYTYTASLEEEAAVYGITKEFVLDGFYLIQDDWKTGEM